jgi:anaerobic ribonucleoside-triphosphate reductase activating protein
MNYTQLNTFDTMNGPGIRVSLFVSGCTLNCKGCFNKEAQNFRAGQPFTEETLSKIIEALDNKYVEGISILGGDPMMKQNIKCITNLLHAINRIHPDKTVWMWTGKLLGELDSDNRDALKYVDVLVDGPFIQELKDGGQYRGSSNQRILIRGKDF